MRAISSGASVAWQTSVNQLAPAGRRLLERLAWFAPEPIPNFLLEVPVLDVAGDNLERGPIGLTLSVPSVSSSVSSPGLTGRSSNHVRGLLDRPVKPGDDSTECAKLIGDTLAEALANLVDYSLARRNADRQEFSVHRLVQDVTRRGLVERERRRSLVEALAWVNAAFAGDPQDVRSWPRLDPLAPHVRVIVEHADGAEISQPTARLGLLLRMKARFGDAEPLYRRALAIDGKSYGPDHPNVAVHLNNLALLLEATNRASDVDPLYRRALTIDETSYGSDHPEVADLNNLAGLLEATNRVSEAEPLYRRALAILVRFTRTTGHGHPNFEEAHANYVAALVKLGRTEAEIEAAVKSVSEDGRQPPP